MQNRICQLCRVACREAWNEAVRDCAALECIYSMVGDLRREALAAIRSSRAKREASEDKLLRMLEQSCKMAQSIHLRQILSEQAKALCMEYLGVSANPSGFGCSIQARM